jgi:hypothetical protein
MTGGVEPLDDDKTGDRCDWLHLAVISDAVGRIVPCCKGDYRGIGAFVLSHVGQGDQVMNTKAYQRARRSLVAPSDSAADGSAKVACADCDGRPRPQVGLGAVGSYVANLPGFSADELASLHNWSRHVEGEAVRMLGIAGWRPDL